jgi:hypothetical protein
MLWQMLKILFFNIKILKIKKTLLKLLSKHMVLKVFYILKLGLGILFVNGVPDYYEARKATLPQISKLGNLPREILKKY